MELKNFQVYICCFGRVDAIVQEIHDFKKITNDTYEAVAYEFSVPTSGVYYFSWNMYNQGFSGVFVIDDFLLEKQHVLGVSDIIAVEDTIRVFPNPTTDGVVRVQLHHPDVTGIGSIRVYDMLGRVVQVETIDKSNATLEYSLSIVDHPSGVYFVEIAIGGVVERKKIIHR